MIQHGVERTVWDKRDYDFLPSFGLTTFDATTLPTDFNIDVGLTMPDQNAEGIFNGCTGETQTDICTDEDLVVYDAKEFYLSTPPFSQTSGRQMRDSLKLAVSRGPKQKDGTQAAKRQAYFNVEQSGAIDYFDAIRIAIWINQSERRSVSIASPWYPDWELPQQGILPVPSSFAWTTAIPGHNWKISGWKTINGKPYLIGKSWQGRNYGENGWCYVSREIFNAVMNITGTGAFVLAAPSPDTQTVSRNIIEIVVDFIRSLFNL